MNRRKFSAITAAIASLFAARFGEATLSQPVPVTDHRPTPKVTRLRIGNSGTADLRNANRIAREAGSAWPWPDPPDDDSNYWAEVIADGDRYFYRVGETAVEISEYEYECVLVNPNLYYFSNALKVHVRLNRKRDGLPDLG